VRLERGSLDASKEVVRSAGWEFVVDTLWRDLLFAFRLLHKNPGSTVWTAESRDREGKPVRDPGSISYSSAMESAAIPATSPKLSDFAARVQREASRRGFTEALRQVVLGDGSTWIWNTATELFTQATQILDRFHAKERLGEVGKVIYGDRPEGKAWIDARCEELDEGHLKSLVHALRSHIGQHKEARECIQYIWRNRRRMRYPLFEKQGFCTSTGVVESGCNAECIVMQSQPLIWPAGKSF